MDPYEIAALAGTGLAAFGASWAATVRSMRAKMVSVEEFAASRQELAMARQELSDTRRELERLKEARDNAKETAAQLAKRQDRMEGELRKTVTEEEFGVYTRQTNTAVMGLTERVSRIMGFVDASG